MNPSERAGIAIVIAKTRTMAAELLAGAFNRHSRFRVVARAATSTEVFEAVRANTVDIVLLSASLQDGPSSGIALVRQLREYRPDIKCVVFVDVPDPEVAVNAFRSGARGVFCPAVSGFKALCKCVERIHAGQIWATSDDLCHVIEAFARLAPLRIVNGDGMSLLSRREEDVVRLLAEGLSNRDIARELKLSEHTIKNYLFHVFDKLGVSNRLELVLYALSSTKRVQMTAGESVEGDLSRGVGAGACVLSAAAND